MLANLKQSFIDRRDPASLIWVSRLRAAIPGVATGEMAALAKQLVNMGRFGEAADALDDLAAGAGAAPAPRTSALRPSHCEPGSTEARRWRRELRNPPYGGTFRQLGKTWADRSRFVQRQPIAI